MVATDPAKILESEKKNGDFEVRASFYLDEVSGTNRLKERMWLVKKRNRLEERYKLGEEGLLSYNASHRFIQVNGREFMVDTPEYPRGGVTHFNNHDEGGQSAMLAIALAEEIRSHLESNV